MPVAALQASTGIDFNLYIKTQGAVPVLYREHNVPISAADITRLNDAGIAYLYVSGKAMEKLRKYLSGNLRNFLADEASSPLARYRILNAAGVQVLGQAFASANLDVVMEKVSDLSDAMSEFVTERNIAAIDVFRILRHDFHTFPHLLNVTIYSLMLAATIQLVQGDGFRDLGVACLLHDLGKLEVPREILGKKGRLTDRERRVIELHPQTGFRKLAERDDLSFAQLMVVYQHHERLDGTGYPVRLPGPEIHEWARLCAVVDIFDALTGERPYRRPLQSTEAMEIVERLSGDGLDVEMVRCWQTIMKSST